MNLVKIIISNYRSIVEDEVSFESFTFFIGRNNYGKSNYLKAVDDLLSFAKTYSDVRELQNKVTESIVVEGFFSGLKEFTPKLKDSKHKDAVEKLIDSDGLIRLRLTIREDGQAETLPVNPSTNAVENPTGWATIYKKLFPETIFVPATADTADQLQEKASTALSKIKKEVMQQFFTSLSAKVEDAFEPVDKFLHGPEAERSADLISLEKDLANEMMGEFSNVKPSVKFELPDSAVIGKGMRINLNDGFHDSEIEQKGHGLQRTALFALMRLLSRHQAKEKTKPSPIFLIEEIEAFLHPSAQQRLSESIVEMSKNYQTIVTTHSPFVLSKKALGGYRKIFRDEGKTGSKCSGPQKHVTEFNSKDYDTVKNSLAYTSNLVSLFADIVVIVEGEEDVGFYTTILSLTGVKDRGMVSFVKSTGGGNSNLHVSYNFFKLLGFDEISVIADLDCLFNAGFKNLLQAAKIDPQFIDEFRAMLGFTEKGQPSLEFVLKNISKVDSKRLDDTIGMLKEQNIFILTKGSPEYYYAETFLSKHADRNKKSLWSFLSDVQELVNYDELESTMKAIFAG